MNRQQLQEYARFGAQARLAALDQERDEILEMFPDLRNGAGRDGAAPKARQDHMSLEARKRQGERMGAYWAARRAKKAEGGTKSSAKKSSQEPKRKSRMSAEARKAQGERMKAYWAAKRAEKQTGAGAQTEAAAATNGASSSKKSGRKAGRTQGRKK